MDPVDDLEVGVRYVVVEGATTGAICAGDYVMRLTADVYLLVSPVLRAVLPRDDYRRASRGARLEVDLAWLDRARARGAA